MCAKLSETIQETAGVQELQSDNEFIKQMVTASLPKNERPRVDSELKRVCTIDLLCMNMNCYAQL